MTMTRRTVVRSLAAVTGDRRDGRGPLADRPSLSRRRSHVIGRGAVVVAAVGAATTVGGQREAKRGAAEARVDDVELAVV